MTAPYPTTQQTGMVRVLIVAIVLMTLAIVFILGAMISRLLNPRIEATAQDTVDFAAAPEVEIGLPPGARVLETHVSAERATFVVETAEGERAVYTTPLIGFGEPVRLVFHTLE